MNLLATNEERRLYLEELTQPYHLSEPFKQEAYVCILLVNDLWVTDQEQGHISKQLIETGCRYAVCAGQQCSSWETAIDTAYISTDENYSPPEETLVMTTCHENESLTDILFHGLMCAFIDYEIPTRILILFIGPNEELKTDIKSCLKADFPEWKETTHCG